MFKKKLKIYVYAIAKDEEKFAQRFMNSCRGADKVIVCDTGSKDRTIDILKENGAIVDEIQVSPFRFDLAKNMALMHCADADVAISLDLDEVMLPGWRKTIEKNWKKGVTMIKSPMIFSWADKGQTVPSTTVWSVKVHCPRSYVWTDPIHEHLILKAGAQEKPLIINKELMRHFPDDTKPERGTRITKIEQWVKDEPNHPRANYALGREYSVMGEYEKAEKALKHYLEVAPGYDTQERYARSHACRMIASALINQKRDPNEVVTWFLRSVGENPSQREPWVHLGWVWGRVGDKEMARACFNRAKMITDETQSVVMEASCWGEQLEKLIAEL